MIPPKVEYLMFDGTEKTRNAIRNAILGKFDEKGEKNYEGNART